MASPKRTGALAAGLLVAVGLTAAQAGASTTTIGQLAPNPYTSEPGPPPYYYPIYKYTPPTAMCTSAQDIQGAGTTYTVPAYATTITAWRTNATSGSGQTMTFKVFRRVGETSAYEVVGHDGPRALTAGGSTEGAVNAFTGLSIPVQPGDLIGLYPDNAATAHDACLFPATGNYLYSETNLADTESAPFASASGDRPNLTADVTVNPPGGSPTQHTLTVNRAGTGYGSVQSSPAGIEACSIGCVHAFDEGTAVTLTATPDAYSTFGGWEGAGCTGTGTCQLTLGADTTVTASFAPKSYSYEYSYGPGYGGPAGAGTGTSGTQAPPVQRKCRNAVGHRSSRRAGSAHCSLKTKLVAKKRTLPALGMTVLTNRRGATLYSLSAEHGTTFICTGECLTAWHPLTVPAGVQPLGPVKLATVTRPEGDVQVTYRGRPLYTFAQDAPGEANGVGVKDVGTWGAVAAPSRKP